MLEKQLEDYNNKAFVNSCCKPLVSSCAIHVSSPRVMTSGFYLLMMFI
jgi:hypothetical protein